MYELVGRKPMVLREMIEQAISGTDHAVVAEERSYVMAVRAEPDPAKKLAIYARAACKTHQRMAPLFLALRDASSTEPEAQQVWQEINDRRAANMRKFAEGSAGRRGNASRCVDRPGRRHRVGDEQCRDVRVADDRTRVVAEAIREVAGRQLEPNTPGVTATIAGYCSRMESLEEEVDRVAAETSFSGVVRVDRGDEIEFAKAYGLAHRGLEVANTIDTQFAVAECGEGNDRA